MEGTQEERLYTLARLGYEAYSACSWCIGDGREVSWQERRETEREAWLASTAVIEGVLLKGQEVGRAVS